jgi:hypothetical protein
MQGTTEQDDQAKRDIMNKRKNEPFLECSENEFRDGSLLSPFEA